MRDLLAHQKDTDDRIKIQQKSFTDKLTDSVFELKQSLEGKLKKQIETSNSELDRCALKTSKAVCELKDQLKSWTILQEAHNKGCRKDHEKLNADLQNNVIRNLEIV